MLPTYEDGTLSFDCPHCKRRNTLWRIEKRIVARPDLARGWLHEFTSCSNAMCGEEILISLPGRVRFDADVSCLWVSSPGEDASTPAEQGEEG